MDFGSDFLFLLQEVFEMKNEKTKKSKKDKKQFLEYKSRTLVRNGSTLYYGNVDGKYVAKMEVLESKKVNDLDVATKVHVEMLETSDDMTTGQKILKTSDRDGIYPALDIANVWLDRAN